MLTLRPPRPDEAGLLTELCLRSKAVWGYDVAFIEACRAELTLTPEILAAHQGMVAEADGQVVGLVQLTLFGEAAILERLFIEPSHLRCGAGRRLFAWAAETARRAGATTLADADPEAAPFYRRMGAADAGTVPSGSIPGRRLPHLVLTL